MTAPVARVQIAPRLKQDLALDLQEFARREQRTLTNAVEYLLTHALEELRENDKRRCGLI